MPLLSSGGRPTPATFRTSAIAVTARPSGPAPTFAFITSEFATSRALTERRALRHHDQHLVRIDVLELAGRKRA